MYIVHSNKYQNDIMSLILKKNYNKYHYWYKNALDVHKNLQYMPL